MHACVRVSVRPCVRASVRPCVHARACALGQFQRYVTFFSNFVLSSGHGKNIVDQSDPFKAYDDLGVQFYITT